jgi:hypothetical protein
MRRNGKRDLVVDVVLVLSLIAVIGLGIWLRAAAPCSLWSMAPAKDMPGRCVMGGK